MNVSIHQLGPSDLGDFIRLVNVFRTVFDITKMENTETAYLQNLLNQSHFQAVVAKSDGEVVGGLTVYLLDQYHTANRLAYLYDVAVLQPYQRQGIGKKLLQHLLLYCKQAGIKEMYVQADNADEEALLFYRSNLPSEEMQAVHFSYHL
jgi:aminoglycoside 3-N-acetyltransferase I